MRVRYIIRHHPGLFTEILVEEEGQTPRQIEDRFTWGAAREYCRHSLEQRGIHPLIEKLEPYTEVFPWVQIQPTTTSAGISHRDSRRNCNKMNTLKQAHTQLTALLKDADAGNDEIRDAAIVLCHELDLWPAGSHDLPNLVEVTRNLALIDTGIGSVDFIEGAIRLAEAFTEVEQELVGESWDGGDWEQAIAQATCGFNAAKRELSEEALRELCRSAIVAWRQAGQIEGKT